MPLSVVTDLGHLLKAGCLITYGKLSMKDLQGKVPRCRNLKKKKQKKKKKKKN